MCKFRLIVLVIASLSSYWTGPLKRESEWGSPEIARLAHKAYFDHVVKGELGEARRVYDEALRLCDAGDHKRAKARILQSLANCDLLEQRYKAALDKYLLALELAERNHDCELQGLLHIARASVYMQFFRIQQSLNEAQALQTYRGCLQRPENRADGDFQIGSSLAMVRGPDAGLPFFLRGIEEADRAGASPQVADGLHRLGAFYLRAGDLHRAEALLERAYLLRRLGRAPQLYLTTFALAELRLRQGDTNAARHLIDRTFELARGGRLPRYLLHLLLGRVLRAQGDSTGALAQYRAAMDAARQWRGRVLPVDSFRLGVDAGLSQVYAAFIPAALERHLSGAGRELSAEAWTAAEVSRELSLQQETENADRPVVGPAAVELHKEYQAQVARLHDAEAAAFAGSTPRAAARVVEERLRLTRIEAKLGLSLGSRGDFPENIPPQISLTSVQHRLGQDRALMSFHLGPKASYRWTVTTTSLNVAVLPPEPEINRQVNAFRHAIESGSPAAADLGRHLFATLFDHTAGGPSHWVLALEGRLFEAPLGALVTSPSGAAVRYLVEDRTLEIVPGSWAIGTGSFTVAGAFLGVGDPIYNRADPRYPGATLASFGNWRRTTVELPRLVGSGSELAACAAEWGGPSTLLTGMNLSVDRLSVELGRAPAVVHFATHFLPTALDHPADVRIALGLVPGTASPHQELLSPTDLTVLRVPGSLVSLSGCHSAAGLALPGVGLLGLSRAFLAAGARGVIGTLWPTPDDSGELFRRFYHHLRSTDIRGPAQALQRAQVEMLHSSGWRSYPRYWAAYELTSRSYGNP